MQSFCGLLTALFLQNMEFHNQVKINNNNKIIIIYYILTEKKIENRENTQDKRSRHFLFLPFQFSLEKKLVLVTDFAEVNLLFS